MVIRFALGRSFVRPRSAHEAAPLRALSTRSPALSYFAAHSRTTPRTSQFPPLASRINLKSSVRTAAFATMHRSPAAMVTKPSVDPDIEIRTPRDPNTLSNYHNYVTRHTAVDFDIDFSKKRLFGSVVLTLESLTDDDVKDVVLDCRCVKLARNTYFVNFLTNVAIWISPSLRSKARVLSSMSATA